MKTNLKQAIFAAESVAHLRGYEVEILSLTDMVRDMYKLMESLTKVSITACSGLDDDYLNPILDELYQFVRSNSI